MKRRNFSGEFKRESARFVLYQNYNVPNAASVMDCQLFHNDAMVTSFLLTTYATSISLRGYSTVTLTPNMIQV